MAVKLEINQRIQLCRDTSEDKNHKKKYYPSRIEEEDKDFFYIAEPLDGTVPVFLPKGQEIEIIFNDEKGTYQFKTTVVSRIDKNIMLIKVTKPSGVEKINRRDFFRLRVFIPFSFRVLPGDKFQYGFPEKQDVIKKSVLSNQIAKDEADKQEGIIKDLSGGGALAAVSEKTELKEGDHIEMWLPLDTQKEPVYLWGDVVRVLPNPDATKWNRDVGIYFSKVDERDRDLIISHILTLQRDLLQKGALHSDK